jgi:hypothetical protein
MNREAYILKHDHKMIRKYLTSQQETEYIINIGINKDKLNKKI